MIELKTPEEIAVMRRAGQVVAGMLERLTTLVRPGLKTKALDDAARTYLREAKAKPAFLGYRGYPACVCVSVNEEVVHGIPGEREIRSGDVVSIDAGAVVDGFFGDAATTVIVGDVDEHLRQLVRVTEESLAAGIAKAQPGNRLSDISYAVQRVIDAASFGIVRDFVGHGIGRAMHEDPAVPNYGAPNLGPRLRAGMVIAIEPMVTLGDYAVEVLSDGWTAVTRDRSMAAHFEHTVAILESGPEILTRRMEN